MLRPLTLCNCDCKILTTAICQGLHRYTMRCTHPSQRCISSRQMTDNIFEQETTALAHEACASRESGILLTDFAAAFPGVNHSWIFHVLERAGLPEFMCRFLRMINCNSTTQVEFARKSREQFSMARCVRQGCPASGLFLCNGFRPYFSMVPGYRHPEKDLPLQIFFNLLRVLLLTIFRWLGSSSIIGNAVGYKTAAKVAMNC